MLTLVYTVYIIYFSTFFVRFHMKNLSKINPKLLLFLGVVGVSLSAIFVKYSSAPSLVTPT